MLKNCKFTSFTDFKSFVVVYVFDPLHLVLVDVLFDTVVVTHQFHVPFQNPNWTFVVASRQKLETLTKQYNL